MRDQDMRSPKHKPARERREKVMPKPFLASLSRA